MRVIDLNKFIAMEVTETIDFYIIDGTTSLIARRDYLEWEMGIDPKSMKVRDIGNFKFLLKYPILHAAN